MTSGSGVMLIRVLGTIFGYKGYSNDLLHVILITRVIRLHQVKFQDLCRVRISTRDHLSVTNSRFNHAAAHSLVCGSTYPNHNVRVHHVIHVPPATRPNGRGLSISKNGHSQVIIVVVIISQVVKGFKSVGF